MNTRRNLTWALLAILAAGPVTGSASAQVPQAAPSGNYQYVNPRVASLWPPLGGHRDAFWLYLAAQRQAARPPAADPRAAAAPATATTAATAPHANRPGGSAAGDYFGRTTVVAPSGVAGLPPRSARPGPFVGPRRR